MDFFKYRIRFRKFGDLRFLSHLDLMRTVERLLRRADLPFRSTEGFHPKPRFVFPLSLPLGVVGLNELVELELMRDAEPGDLLPLLNAHAPQGLEFLAIERIPPLAGGQVCRATYRLAVPADRHAPLADACRSVLAQPECWVERTHPNPRKINIRPFLLDLRQTGDALEMNLQVTPNGTARADEVVRLLGLGDLLDNGAVLERTDLELKPQTTLPVPSASALGSQRVEPEADAVLADP